MAQFLAQTSLSGLAPELALAALVCATLMAGLPASGRRYWKLIGPLGALCAFALALTTVPAVEAPGLIRVDGLSIGWQLLIFLAAVPFALLLRGEDEVPTALMLGSLLGMGLLASAGNLLMLFIGLEFMSLPAYLLVARGARRAPAREAAMKYFFAGGTGGSLFLFGLALYYAAGRTLAFSASTGPMAEAGLALMGVGALFKVGAFPFHFWLPDVYESADPELAGFLSTSMKAAAVLLLMRVAALSPHSGFVRCLPWVGGVTALFGALLALRQQRLQRLLAYSSISHAGNVILGVGAWAALGAVPGEASSIYYYLAAYLFMSNGAFLFLRQTGLRERCEVTGLSRRDAPGALLFAVLLLALGGIPPTAGFLAKLLIFWEAIKAAAYGPVILAGAAALASLGYYLGLVRQMYLDEPLPAQAAAPARPGDRFGSIILAACAAPAAVLGLAPWLIGVFSRLLSP